MILAYAIYVKLDVIETTFKFRPSSKSAVMKSRRRRMIDRFRIMGSPVSHLRSSFPLTYRFEACGLCPISKNCTTRSVMMPRWTSFECTTSPVNILHSIGPYLHHSTLDVYCLVGQGSHSPLRARNLEFNFDGNKKNLNFLCHLRLRYLKVQPRWARLFRMNRKVG